MTDLLRLGNREEVTLVLAVRDVDRLGNGVRVAVSDVLDVMVRDAVGVGCALLERLALGDLERNDDVPCTANDAIERGEREELGDLDGADVVDSATKSIGAGDCDACEAVSPALAAALGLSVVYGLLVAVGESRDTTASARRLRAVHLSGTTAASSLLSRSVLTASMTGLPCLVAASAAASVSRLPAIQ